LPKFQAWFVANNPGLSTYNCTREQFFSALKQYRTSETDDDLSKSEKQKLIGFVGDELKYVRIDVTLSVLTSESTAELIDVRKVVDDMVDQMNANSPAGMNNAFGASWTWVFVESELGVVQGFFQGLVLCFPVAFAVLVFATSNLLVSLYAIVSIGFIVSNVLAVVKWNGGALGIAEAVAGVIVIGFSVDYVIHLGHMFVDATHSEGLRGRSERFVYASENMVATVMAGAITTFGAALPLFACQLTFFPKMAMLMATTIAFSLMFSMGFFMGMCLLIGPVGRFSDMDWIAEKIGIAPFLESIGCLKRNPHSPDKVRPEAEDVEMDQKKSAAAERPNANKSVLFVKPQENSKTMAGSLAQPGPPTAADETRT